MNLKEKIARIAESQGINRSELILEEIEDFSKEHAKHGGYSVEVSYEGNGEVENITIQCMATDIIDVDVCSHVNPATLIELSDSIVYCRKSSGEGNRYILNLQRRRRETPLSERLRFGMEGPK
jgi:hypothetical protein